MIFRTDLALEASENLPEKIDGITQKTETIDGIKVTEITIKTNEASKKIGKPIGEYITIELPNFTDNARNSQNKVKTISTKLQALLPESGLVFVVGLGNYAITPDALGPKTVKSILATRHITGEVARSTGLEALRPVAILAPGVLGQTGIEVSEIILSISKKINPTAIIVIDALASKETKRLGSTIQISNTGISPGAGVGNSRPCINKDVIGIPVISIGVPTVVDAITLAGDLIPDIDKKMSAQIKNKINPRGEPMMVTPREIDLLIDRASELIAMSINCALQKEFSLNDIMALV
ncbi:MAG: Germination protease [Eubacteriales bacterium SKADARSKE-1]|nr:Germination protease [Eubacteriales bacterium SKADARSKE-1]